VSAPFFCQKKKLFFFIFCWRERDLNCVALFAKAAALLLLSIEKAAIYD
jgi:hypothetical protein